MSTHSSGYYSIDEDYNIIGFNETAKELYPSLTLGLKCHKALMGLDSPCPVCPVYNKICGPRTYLDPIRHIYETVDAVQIVLPDGKRGHALVFSTVDEGERLSGSIPTGEESLRLLGAINLLASKYAVIFDLHLDTNRISVLRAQNPFDDHPADLRDNMLYEDAVNALLIPHVHPEDQNAVRHLLELSHVRKRLNQMPSFKVHFRVPKDQMHYFYLLIARNGEAEDYQDIVFSIACEDNDVNSLRIYQNQLDALMSSLTHCPGYFHLDVTEDAVLKVGGNSAFVAGISDFDSIDALIHDMAAFICTEQDRLDFCAAFNRNALMQAYDSGKVEIIRESRCYYDDSIARWSRYTLRLVVNPSNDHLEGILYGTDITQQRQAYETQAGIVQALSSNYLDVLLLNTRNKTAILIKYNSFTPPTANHDPQNAYPYDTLLHSYISKIVHPEDQVSAALAMNLDRAVKELEQKQEYVGRYRILRDGQTHHYQFRFIRSAEHGVMVLGLLDVDDIVQAEVEQQNLLKDALEEAKRANAAKSRFLARMSHDMRTPLNGILGILEVDRKHADDVEYLKKNREKASMVVNHLVSLINDVLDMAKIEDGSLVLAHNPFNIQEEGMEAAVLISLQAQSRNIRVKMIPSHWEERLNYVYGSPLHLRRALMNIYSNCIKYNRDGGSVTTQVEVVCSDAQTVTYRWTIADTGIGMKPEYLKQIFDPFSQERTDARSVYQGTGLGMSIAKAIIEQMGGTLEVRSQWQVGSTFLVTIPFQLADAKDVATVIASESPDIRGMHILLVEDNQLNREIAEEILREEGATVTSAVNGQEAVELVRAAADYTFDLVLMDVMMPVMDGYEATRSIRKLNKPDSTTLPIVAMTANAFAEDIQRSLDAGMNAHLAKPLDVAKLLRVISHYNRRIGR